jgi:hypothetical protein
METLSRVAVVTLVVREHLAVVLLLETIALLIIGAYLVVLLEQLQLAAKVALEAGLAVEVNQQPMAQLVALVVTEYLVVVALKHLALVR